ncbi:MAG: N-acetylgalactosamine 6-sulfate sulfatase, partial [Planctomycetota bacterium]|nr:N-acetylgalactosamine 6-sulfate sulfatase [Planctomycetota bacterium]
GVELPAKVTLDGVSIAPILLGQAETTSREWIMALGHGAAKLDEKGVHGASPYVSRVIRDLDWKVWVNESGEIDQLYHMKVDPQETDNLLSENRPLSDEASKRLAKFKAVVRQLPATDARPRYLPRNPNPWDMKVKPSKSN